MNTAAGAQDFSDKNGLLRIYDVWIYNLWRPGKKASMLSQKIWSPSMFESHEILSDGTLVQKN
jgi:hypothetical protein